MQIDNPPAFPMACPVDFEIAHSGMTLRDYFAGQVLTAALGVDAPPHSSREDDAVMIARACYALADAMLAERSKASGQ